MDENQSTEVAGEESGSALRTKYEAEMTARKEAERANQELFAELTIVRGGHDLVKASDLVGVAGDQLAEKAAELQAQRVQERDEFFAAEAARRGIKLESNGEGGSTPSGLNRVASLGGLAGTAPGQQKKDVKDMSADELLMDVFSEG